MTLDTTCILPGEAAFARLHRLGRSIPLVVQSADRTPDPVAMVEALPRDTSAFLFETPGAPLELEQRTFLSWDPEWEIVLRRKVLESSGTRAPASRRRCDDPLAVVRAALYAEGAALGFGPLPYDSGFSGGLVGYFSYDFKNWLERLPDSVTDDLGTPEMRLAMVRRVVSWDHRVGSRTLHLHHLCRSHRPRTDWLRAVDALQSFCDEVAHLERAAHTRLAVDDVASARLPAVGLRTALRSNLDRDAYDKMLAHAREHIFAGDIYQANVSHRFDAPYAGSGVALYRRLREINPSPFATYLQFPEHEVVSCSPERLVRVRAGHVETRPIAGTRPRGLTTREDESLERELLSNEKERAEHLMIVDMARNDIGRVCELGSVRVERFMAIERYSHVCHLVSNVTGTLGEGRDALNALEATFPGASITGVPKVRCMQIIDELEQCRRGVYTGSAGYLGLNGDMDLNILIRTFFLQDEHAYFHVGGGIVADSDADSEYRETLAKGRALLEALQGPLAHASTTLRHGDGSAGETAAAALAVVRTAPPRGRIAPRQPSDMEG